MKKIIIYGAGQECERLLERNPMLARSVEMIIDGNPAKTGTSIGGVEIVEKEVLKGFPDGTEIGISSLKYFDEIEEDVHSLNPGVVCKRLDVLVDETLPVIGECSFCHRPVRYWKPAGTDNHTKYRIIGNGERFSTCPYCGAIDRNRWQKYVLRNCSEILKTGGRVLHFAPEEGLRRIFECNSNIDYFPADLVRTDVPYKVDITDIPFRDGFFNFIIANHVMEHIPDEAKAVTELKRVLKPAGSIYLSFPITMETDTLESEAYAKSEELRRHYYGQEDHVRLYGRDFKEHFERYGLDVKVYTPTDYMTEDEAKWKGLIPEDVILEMRISD